MSPSDLVSPRRAFLLSVASRIRGPGGVKATLLSFHPVLSPRTCFASLNIIYNWRRGTGPRNPPHAIVVPQPRSGERMQPTAQAVGPLSPKTTAAPKGRKKRRGPELSSIVPLWLAVHHSSRDRIILAFSTDRCDKQPLPPLEGKRKMVDDASRCCQLGFSQSDTKSVEPVFQLLIPQYFASKSFICKNLAGSARI